jgi:polyisoprenoid-binding protein YceI
MIAAVAVAVAIVVGGPFVFFHFIEGSAPAPLSLPSASPSTDATSGTTPANGTTDVDGVWSVATGSQAGYRVKEILFGQSHTAVGRTSAVTGTMTVSGTSVTAGEFSADLTKVSSDQSLRDNQFQGRIMDTADFPTATFTLTHPIRLGTLPAEGKQVTETAAGTLTMHGTTRAITFQVTAQRSGTTIEISGAIPILFADWNIANPSGGPATTQNHGTLEFLINLLHT